MGTSVKVTKKGFDLNSLPTYNTGSRLIMEQTAWYHTENYHEEYKPVKEIKSEKIFK